MTNVVIKYDIQGQEDIEDTTKDLEGLDKATEKTKKSVNNLDKSAAGLEGALSGLSDALGMISPQFSAIAKSATGAIGGVKKLTTGFKAFDTVLRASVIGLILTTITALGVQLTKTAKGTEFLRKAFATLQGIGNALLDVFINLDKIFSRNILDVFEKNIKASQKYSDTLKDIRVQARALNSEVTRLSGEYEILSQIADDATLSLQKQNEAAIEAGKVAEDLALTNSKIADNNLKKIEEEIRKELLLFGIQEEKNVSIQTQLNRLKEQGEKLDEDLMDRFNQATIEYENSLIQQQVAFQQNQTRIRQIDQDSFERRLDFLVDFTDNQKAINERVIGDETLSIKEREKLLKETIEFTNKAFENAFNAFQEQAGKRIDINKLLKESDADVAFNYIKGLKLSDTETGRLLEFLRERRTFTQDLAEAEKDLNKEKEEAAEEREKNRQERFERWKEDQLERLEKEKKAEEDRKKRLEEAAAYEEYLDKRVAENKKELVFESTQLAIEALNVLAEKERGFAVAALAVEKALAIADIIINLQKELSAIAVNAAANPANAWTGGVAGLAQFGTLASIAKARAAISTGIVLTQTFGELGGFKDGVIDLEGPGTATSDSIPAYLSRGESVMTALETSKYRPTLQAIRDDLVDPDLINGIATGKIDILDNTKVVEVPRTQINLDQNGFTQHIVSKANRTIIRRNRYRG